MPSFETYRHMTKTLYFILLLGTQDFLVDFGSERCNNNTNGKQSNITQGAYAMVLVNRLVLYYNINCK